METVIWGMFPHAQGIPHELLAEIFLDYLKVEKQICSLWRHVALCTAKLWTSFSLRINKEVKGGRVDHISFARAWLVWACPYPLNVMLDVHANASSHIVDRILWSAHRLQSISLHLPYTHFQPLVDFPAGFMPLLESVAISVDIPYCNPYYNQEAALSVGKITAFEAAPLLSSVTLTSTSLLGTNILMP